MTKSRIKSLKILEDFEIYQGESNLYPHIARDIACGLMGYKIQSLPVGHQLDVDSNLVIIVGRNGSGKTTLLSKLEFQLNFGVESLYVDGSKPPKYFDMEYAGKKPMIRHLKPFEQPSGLITLPKYSESNTCLSNEDPHQSEIEKSKLSTGQYALQFFEEYLSSKEHYSDNNIFTIDQPETNIDIFGRRKLVELVSNFALINDAQIFIATHEKQFLGVDGIVINLLDIPARTYRTRDFDINKYIDK